MARFNVMRHDHVAVVSMDDGENRFNPDFLTEFLSVLDQVEYSDASVMVVTSGHEKIWSNGIDLDWLAPEVQAGRVEVLKSFLYQMNDVFRRLLLFPMPTIAAINGHAFAGGAITSCCYDFRFMRSDRGYFCFPEVDIHIPFLPGMIAICRKAIPAALFEELYYTGKRAVAEELQRHHVIREAAPAEALMEEVMAFAGPLKKDRTTYGVMKQRLNAPIVKVLDELDPPVIETGRFLAE